MNHRVTHGLMLLALLVHPVASVAADANPEFDPFLNAYTVAWNTHDGQTLAALFAPDADFIMRSLPRVVGREAIGQWWSTYFSRVDEGREGTFDLVTIRDLAPGVRLVNVDTKTSGTNAQGELLEPRLARGTWVLVKNGETWLIAAMRGLPAEGEQRTRPGTDR